MSCSRVFSRSAIFVSSPLRRRLFSTRSVKASDAAVLLSSGRLTSKLQEREKRMHELSSKVSDVTSASKSTHIEFSRLTTMLERKHELDATLKQMRDLEAILDETKTNEHDPELLQMAFQELDSLQSRANDLASEVLDNMVEKDEADDRNAVLEIRSGTGGSEAQLFAMDLFRMYAAYAEYRKWKFNVVDMASTDVGGVREVVVDVIGKNVFGTLKLEAGVHRVQRVPKTETLGRTHTSTATVAVLPEASETDVVIGPNDLRIDVFRSSGAGGQSVNTTDSAVRITHLPTGLAVAIQDERSQIQNKLKAMALLRSRLFAMKRAELHARKAALNSALVGDGSRSERMRTYNAAQDRVTDHRCGYNTTMRVLIEPQTLGALFEHVRKWHDRQLVDEL